MSEVSTQTSASHPRFGMVVDVNRCVGCQTCTISCKHVNDTPPGVQWRRVLDVERGVFPDVERLFLVVGCQHCANPPCVPVCPTGATDQREDGLVTMDYDKCIGCGYCAVACPYQARTIVHDQAWYYGKPTRQEETTRHQERLGVATKCTFCIEKIDTASQSEKVPGEALDVTPACAASCITQAIRFGDFNDPTSTVSELVRDNAYFQMHEELGTDPQIKYLYEVPHATPGQSARPEDIDDEKLRDPTNPLVGQRQTFWDARAATNFTLGGLSTGLALVSFVLFLAGWLDAAALVGLNVLAGVGMAVGLGAVFLEIGRKERFLRVLLRPQSSWMTRETYAVAVFYPAIVWSLVSPSLAVFSVIALAALAFLYCQARILHAAKGIPAWRAPAVPGLLVSTGLAEGASLLGLVAAIMPSALSSLGLPIGSPVAVCGAGLCLGAFVLWCGYQSSARANGIGPLARDALDAVDPWLRWAGYGGAAVAFAIAAALPAESAASTAALLAGGTLGLAAGIVMKLTVILRACHQQGYAVPKMPQRGSGSRAAPIRLGPGPSRVADPS